MHKTMRPVFHFAAAARLAQKHDGKMFLKTITGFLFCASKFQKMNKTLFIYFYETSIKFMSKCQIDLGENWTLNKSSKFGSML